MSSIMCKSSVNQDQGPHFLQSKGLRYLVPLHHRTTHLRQSNFFFAELKNHSCLAGTHCFGRGPKAQVIAMDWKGLHPQVSNLHSSWAIYETKQLPPTTLWMLKLPILVPLLRCKHTQMPWQTSHVHYFSRRAQDCGDAQIISLVTTSQQSWSAIKFFSMGLRFCPPQQCQIQTGVRNGKEK